MATDDGHMTPAGLVQSLLDLDDPRSIGLRRTITLSEIIGWAREARASMVPEPTTVERVVEQLDEIGLRIAAWCPHGFDSARSHDYYMAAELRNSLDDIRELLGYERLHGARDGSTHPPRSSL